VVSLRREKTRGQTRRKILKPTKGCCKKKAKSVHGRWDEKQLEQEQVKEYSDFFSSFFVF